MNPEPKHPPDNGYLWNSVLQCWVHEGEINKALDLAQLAIEEYYNGNRKFAVAWLIRAVEANERAK